MNNVGTAVRESTSSAPTDVLALASGPAEIAAACEARAVDAQLFYNSTERAAGSLIQRADRYVSSGRVLLALCFASASVAGLLASWQHRRIYRVWRLRHPKEVMKHRRIMWLLGAGSLSIFLFMLSPVGLLRQHESLLENVEMLDTLAVRGLILKRQYELTASQAMAGGHGRSTALAEYNKCECEWATLMRERVAIDEDV
ncbi:hypothetical protein ERJ75_001760300 [Trypanosoma vivax]|nr:hypothetical protein TRVL_08967 [Trypanosoma vivax]KAH8604008.1 hypothetical protein ERJ75_001760300 [Trypanosoma vivax]